MYAALLRLKSLKMEQEATNVKVKDEPIEGAEYSEVKDCADIKKKRNESQVCPDPVKSTLNVEPAVKTEEEVVKKEPSDKDKNVKKEPTSDDEAKNYSTTEPQNVPKQLENGTKDLNENSKSSKYEATVEDQKSSKYISDENFKRNMHHMFPKVHADIIQTFKREFCGLCGAHLDSEKRAWTHYFSSEHNHALTKRKKFAYPPFWIMIKLALADMKSDGASKKNIYDFIVKSYPGVKTLKEAEIYDQLGKNLVEMVTRYQNVKIGDNGQYSLRNTSRGKGSTIEKQNEPPSRYFQSDKRYFIPDNSLGHGQPSPPPEYKHHGGYEALHKDRNFGYRKFVASTRRAFEDEKVRGYGDGRNERESERNERRRRIGNRSQSRSKIREGSRNRDNSIRNGRRSKSRQNKDSRSLRSSSNSRNNRRRSSSRSRINRREKSKHRESTRQRRKSKSRQRNNSNSRSSRRSRERSPLTSQNVKLEMNPAMNPSLDKQAPPPLQYQLPPMPMMSMQGSMDGGGAPIIIIPSNLSSGGFPPELIAGNLGFPGMPMFSTNNFQPQFGSFQANTMPIQSQMFQIPHQVPGIPSPPLSASPPLQSRVPM